MKTRSHRLPLTGLRAVQNARSRIYIPGSDPVLTRTRQAQATIRLLPAFSDDEPTGTANRPLWRQEVVDRLKTPLTRYHE